jgi:ribosomal protein S18 acetylase RimI-like enzyme
MKGWLKRAARWLLGDYELYRIYRLDLAACEPPPDAKVSLRRIVDLGDMANSTDPEIRSLLAYAGEGAYGYGAWVDGALACGCWFWAGARYRTRGFWPLEPGEAKLVQITTASRFQGRGLASALIRFASHEMRTEGFRRAYARIWHSNLPSVRLFEGAGWTYTAFVAVVHPFSARRPLRLVRRRMGRETARPSK